MNHFKHIILALILALSYPINLNADEKFIKIDTATGQKKVSSIGEADVLTLASEDVVTPFMMDDDANIPVVGSFLTVETGAASFRYTEPNAGTDVTTDLEEEGEISSTVITGNASASTAGQVIRSTGNNTAAWGALDIADPDALIGLLSSVNGGTGIDSSALTGTLKVSSGTWSADAGIADLAASTSLDLAGIITNETGTGALVLGTNPVLTTPSIGNFTNSTHNHTNAAGGGQIDHGSALTGLGDDDHSQYVLDTGDNISGPINFTDGAGDSPTLTFTPQTGTSFNILVEDSTNDLQIQSASTGVTESIDISNPGAGTVELNVDGNILIAGVSVCQQDGTNCPISAVTNFAIREVPTGIIDGSNKVFTLANTPDIGTEEVFLNGLLRNSGGDDYTISGLTITFNDAPFTGDKILVSYQF